LYLIRDPLRVLSELNQMNKKGAKHLGGAEVTWENVVQVHAGLYPALKALAEAADWLR